MSIRRSRRTRTATVLAGITVASLTGLAVAGGASAAPTASADGSSAVEASSEAPSRGDALPDVSADAGGWPAELTEHTRLFVNPYRSYLVQIRDGEPTLVLSTGFDSCYFMTQNGVLRYPC
jgi:hypothetical protein